MKNGLEQKYWTKKRQTRKYRKFNIFNASNIEKPKQMNPLEKKNYFLGKKKSF